MTMHQSRFHFENISLCESEAARCMMYDEVCQSIKNSDLKKPTIKMTTY